MAKNTLVYFTKDLRAKPTVFLTADGTTKKEIFAPSTEGSRVDNIIICSNDTVQRVGFLKLHNKTTSEVCSLGHITIPAGAGTNGSVASVSGLNRTNLPWLKIDAQGNPFINLNYNMVLEIVLDAAVSATKEISFAILGANYDA